MGAVFVGTAAHSLLPEPVEDSTIIKIMIQIISPGTATTTRLLLPEAAEEEEEEAAATQTAAPRAAASGPISSSIFTRLSVTTSSVEEAEAEAEAEEAGQPMAPIAAVIAGGTMAAAAEVPGPGPGPDPAARQSAVTYIARSSFSRRTFAFSSPTGRT